MYYFWHNIGQKCVHWKQYSRSFILKFANIIKCPCAKNTYNMMQSFSLQTNTDMRTFPTISLLCPDTKFQLLNCSGLFLDRKVCPLYHRFLICILINSKGLGGK